ncbi:molybdopterin-dependent oxidoreductase [Chloroflexota bacterium]
MGAIPEKWDNEKSIKTLIKSTGFCACSQTSMMAFIDVKDGKILRIRPFRYDWKYKPEEFNPWKIEARDKVFEPPMKSMIVPYAFGYKKRIYSPNRILYPLKRVDWDPDGERNPQNRGVSGYVRISWDEALDIITKEIKRVIKQYGPYAILAQGDGHGEGKMVHAAHGCMTGLLELLGGYTLQLRNPDSWEGWYWGAKHVWGMDPVGVQWPYQTNLVQDVAQNTDLLLIWGGDPETTTWGFGAGHGISRLFYWYTDLNIKQVYICPDLNYGAAVHADKWIPILPNTDAALQLAIAYQWISEETYNKEYIATHAYGFEEFEKYVTGKEDGVAKTPTWAAKITGVPSRIIKALAREWASKATSIAHCLGGPFIRGQYCHEPARLEVFLLAMQGLGKPGVNQFLFNFGGVFNNGHYIRWKRNKWCLPPKPNGVVMPNPVTAFRGYKLHYTPMPKQVIPKTMIHEAILKGSFTIYGSSLQTMPTEDQFKKYDYPAEGCSPIHMIWTDTPCLMTCWNDSNSVVKAYRHPSIEFMMAQHPWLENDCLFADIILPVSTKYEEDDIGQDLHSIQYDMLCLEDKCIEPIGESMSDYEIVCAVAERLGLLEEYTEGKSVQDWIRDGFEHSGLPEAGLCTWEKFEENRYFVAPTDPKWQTYPAGMYEFYNDPENNPLETPSGKIEFYSQNLAKHFPDDKERPPVPHWIPYGDYHKESLLLPRAKQFPLICMSNHGRWRMHAQLDDVTWFHEIETCKVIGPDEYLYEPCWINPGTAAARNIKNGDVVKVFNERGVVLCGAYVTERIMPGVAYVDHGARYDPIVPGEIDRGGAINTITPYNITSKNCAGHVVSGFLVEAERADLDELRKQNPEAFNRPYDKASGQKFERVLFGGK